jgi:hypothetical protein
MDDRVQVNEPSVRVYQPLRKYLWIGAFLLAFFLLMGITSVVVALTSADGSFARPEAAAIIFGCFWSAWVLLSIYVLAFYLRARLRISATAITTVGVFRTATVLLDEITSARWRAWPAGGSLVLRGPTGRVVIEFAAYSDGPNLVPFFREALRPEVQHGLERFEATSVPTSEGFQRRKERDRRMSYYTLPLLGGALIAYAIWDP